MCFFFFLNLLYESSLNLMDGMMSNLQQSILVEGSTLKACCYGSEYHEKQ